jgi:LasA protease
MSKLKTLLWSMVLAGVFLSACGSLPAVEAPTPIPVLPTATVGPTAIPERTVFAPGEIVDYSAQSGDTLPVVAAHFNTSVEEILTANPDLPEFTTTLPAGLPMSIPAYYLPLTGSPFQVIPDSEVVNGPSAVAFDLKMEIQGKPGFLSGLSDYVRSDQRPAWEVIELVAQDYSIHPRLLLALLEYQSEALSKPFPLGDEASYAMGNEKPLSRGLYNQLAWAAGLLNNGYYGWRLGELRDIELIDGHLVRPDPWQNAGTVALYAFFAETMGADQFNAAVGEDGLVEVYREFWGEPFDFEIDLIPANLQQPQLGLPFLPDRIWDYSGGPHSSWGNGLPFGAIDFAPPAVEGGCASSIEWVAAPVNGTIVRSKDAAIVLDLDADRDERTGWGILFFHVAAKDQIPVGSIVNEGDQLGHPSCEGGRSTGTHVHIARKYNGEWISAAGVVPFTLDSWVVGYGAEEYLGTMTKGSKVVEACTCTTSANRIFYQLTPEE